MVGNKLLCEAMMWFCHSEMGQMQHCVVCSEGHRQILSKSRHTWGANPKNLTSVWMSIVLKLPLTCFHSCLVTDSGFLSTTTIFEWLFTFSCCQQLAGRHIPTQMAIETWFLNCSGIQYNQHWHKKPSPAATFNLTLQPSIMKLAIY